MNVFCDNLPVAAVFLVVAAFSWIFGGSSAPHLLPVIPWLWVLCLEILFFLPQRYDGESLADARVRVWKSLSRDPVFYISLAFMLMILMPLCNRGLCTVCDYPAILSGMDPAPRVPYAPFCVNAREHLGVVIWFIPSLTALLAARHSLTRQGRRQLVTMMVINASLIASLGFLQQATGAKAPFWLDIGSGEPFFATFGYPNMAGAFFTAMFAVSAGLWQDDIRRSIAEAHERLHNPPEYDEMDRKKKYRPKIVMRHKMLVPTGLCFFAALASLSRAAIVLSFSILGFWFIYLNLSLFTVRRSIRSAKPYLWMIFGVAIATIMICIFSPDNFKSEVSTLSPVEMADRITGKKQCHTRVATEIFRRHPLFGVGGWGYRHFSFGIMTDQERLMISGGNGNANVHNDYMQFLCEHGLVGTGLLLAIIVLLVAPAVQTWDLETKRSKFLKRTNTPRPVALFALPAAVVGILLAVGANLIHAFGDCILRSAAVLSQMLLLLGCIGGYLPEKKDIQ